MKPKRNPFEFKEEGRGFDLLTIDEKIKIVTDDWNIMAKANGLATKRFPFMITKGVASNYNNIKRCVTTQWWWDSYRDALKVIPNCPFCMGDNERDWTATLDWFVRTDITAKLLEDTKSYGRGTNKSKSNHGGGLGRSFEQSGEPDKFGGR